MYTKQEFGKALKRRIEDKSSISSIASWSYSLYLDKDVEQDLNNIFLAISDMEMGQQFEYTYEELSDIADRLIAGEDVKL